MTEVIAERTFLVADLVWFAEVSGDWNPIHVDEVQARRTIAGRVVVHGMFSLLWALESHVATGGAVPHRLQAFFRQPVYLGERVELRRYTDAGKTRLALASQTTELASFLLSGIGRPDETTLPAGRPAPTAAENKTLEDIKGASGNLKISADVADLQHAFPSLVKSLGRLPIATILSCSRLVGMKCPGLHSLFTGLDLTFAERSEPILEWHVVRMVSPLAPLSIDINGGGVTGHISAFVRPAPVRQASMAEVVGLLSPTEFLGLRALVLGGSRGLGELTAKLLASGGCDVLLSYQSGREDAERIVTEITLAGGQCRCFQFDISRPEGLRDHVENWQPDLLFHYVTPRITKQTFGQFNQALYKTFYDAYVTAYEAAVSELMAHAQHRLWALYPSTIFADIAPDGFAEYAAAKKQGEVMCQSLQLRFPNFYAVTERFPRLATDQAMALIPQKTEPALQVMLGAIKGLAEQMKAVKQ